MCEVGVLGDKQHTDFTKVFLFLHRLGFKIAGIYEPSERIISMLDWFPFAAARASESGRWRLPIIQLFNFLSDSHRGTNCNSPICDRPSWSIPESLG